MIPPLRGPAAHWRCCPAQPKGRRTRAAVWLVIATAGLALGSMLPVAPLRVLVATPLALLVPGWAVLLIAFDAAPPPPLPATTLTALLSLAAYPLLAVGLGFGGGPVDRQRVLAAVAALVLLALVITVCRGLAGAVAAPSPRHAQEQVTQAAHGGTGVTGSTWMAERRVLAMPATYVIAALAATALALAMLRLLPQAPPLPYSTLSLAGRWAQLDHVVAQTGGRVDVLLHIANHTGRAEIYRLRVDMDGREEGGARTLRLGSEATWGGTVVGVAARDGRLHRLQIALDSDTSRQSLTVWVRDATPSDRQGLGVRRGRPSRPAGREGAAGRAGCAGCRVSVGTRGSGQAPGQDDSPGRARSGWSGTSSHPHPRHSGHVG